MAGPTQLPFAQMARRFVTSRCKPVPLLLSAVCVVLVLTLAYLKRGPADDTGEVWIPPLPPIQIITSRPARPETIQVPASVNQIVVSVNQTVVSIDRAIPAIPDTKAEAGRAEEEEFSRRRKLYETVCRPGLGGPGGDVYYWRPAKLAVCSVPKTGSTFWKRIFMYLSHDWDNKRNVSSPFDLSRFFVHFADKQNTQWASYTAMKPFFDTFNKVLFTRDPYARLWSAYIDKFVLPDSWLDHGKAIVQRRDDLKKRRFCSDDVEFHEFLDFVLNSNRDVHWKPVYKVCNPCAFLPQYVGKMETFSTDVVHILRKFGLEKVIEGHDPAFSAEDEIRMLTEYHFRLYEERPGLRKCLLDHTALAKRLWKAFVMNGYIDEKQPFPFMEFSRAVDRERDPRWAGQIATDLLLRYHRASPAKTARQRRDYRRSVMVKQYRSVPRELLDKLVAVYNGDFVLFGYEARPADIFVPTL